MQHVTIGKGTIIGNNVFIGPNTSILNDKYPPTHNPKEIVDIKDNVIIGGGVTILPGVIIDIDAVIGAGSVVTENISAGLMVAGNPAKIIGTKEEYIMKKRCNKL